MYLKLAVRNAKRSAVDYLLYIFTVTILISIMCLSNCMAAFGAAAGFQTASLPLLIVLIMVAMVDYIKTFMLKQRAKEFAIYMLMGMEKRILSLLFCIELSIIGAVCFLLGVLFGVGVYYLCFYAAHSGVEDQCTFSVMISSIFQTFVCFCLAELLSSLHMRRKLYKLQINRLMKEKCRNRPLKTIKLNAWGAWLIVCIFTVLTMLCGMVFIPDNKGDVLLSFLSVPVLGSIFVFYRWIYAYFFNKRLACSEELCQGTRLYRIAEMTTDAYTSAGINFIFCTCLLCSAASFVFGVLLLNPNISVFSSDSQQWMGVLQINLCIIFLVIYFFILSTLQIVELKRQAGHLKIMYCMGKNQIELRALIKTGILIKLFAPAFMCFVLLGITAPFANVKLNTMLPAAMHNMVFDALAGFIVCFIVLELSYFVIIYRIGGRYIKGSITR